MAVIVAGAFVRTAGWQDVPLAGVPSPLPGTPVPLPAAPRAFAWTVPVPAAPIVSPLLTAHLVITSHLPGVIAAYRRDDGREVWRAEINPEQPLATDGTHLFVAAGDALHALRTADGTVAWRSPAGPLTAPLLVKDGWIIAATEGRLTARRASDGSTVWAVDSGPQREAAAISGDILFAPMANGRVVARDLANGQTRWECRLGGAPGEPLVVDDTLFVGASDKVFYALDATSGEIAWRIRVGAIIRGAAAFDTERVYFAALDNTVRAVDRSHGALRWQKGVPFRPLTGPVVAGGVLFISGPGAAVQLLRTADGNSAGRVAFPSRLAQAPGVAETPGGVVLAGVTGGLEESWMLSLTLPIAVAVRALPSR